jgi:hypothetical protein
MNNLVTNEQLTRAINAQTDKLMLRMDGLEDKLTLRICGILGGLLTLGFAAIGLAIAFS